MATGNYSERILDIMNSIGLSKSGLATKMGIQKQNVNVLLQTNNIDKLLSIAKILGVSINQIVGEDEASEDVKGCIIYRGVNHLINSKADIVRILQELD